MSSLLFAGKRLVLLGLLGVIPFVATAQNAFTPQGSEYPITGSLPGDQVFPQVKLNNSGGFVVWQDNATDGDGLGISAQRIDVSLSGTLAPFRVNEQAADDQENPQVALLNNGSAVFVWQGGKYGFQHIYARFLNKDGTFATGDVLVNSYMNSQQINPVVAALSDGSAVIAWSSYEQDGSLQGIFSQRFLASGEKLGNEFKVNQTTRLNQRSPSVTALVNGNFVIAWVSEKLRAVVNNRDESGRNSDRGGGGEMYDVDVYARLFDAGGAPLSNELKLNSHSNVCAHPSASGGADGGFAVAWNERVGRIVVDGAVRTNGWDIAARCFDASGVPQGAEQTVNVETYGDQFSPKISSLGTDYFLVWTSLGQDGSREGVYGRYLAAPGSFNGDEFRVNTTTISQQFQPAVASDGDRRFLVIWSSFVGGLGSFDLFSQRYAISAQALEAPAAPYVSALSQSRLSVTWPRLAGYDVESYQLAIDGNSTPVSVSKNMFSLMQLGAGSSHTFRLAYKLIDGRVSPFSPVATGTTWGDDGNFDGLPDDWQVLYWGSDSSKWPAASLDSDDDGASNLQEFLADTNPIDAKSVLLTRITTSIQGQRLEWNTKAGLIFQVQTSADFKTWNDVGSPRFAAGDTDSIPVSGNTQASFYRVIRMR